MSKELSTYHLQDSAIVQLQSVFDSTKDHYTQVQLDDSNALFSMCSIIAKSIGIKCHFPGHIPEETSVEEAVKAIASASQFAIRRVELNEKWWQVDNGALLGFIEEDSTPCALMPCKDGGYDVLMLRGGCLDKQKLTPELLAQLSVLAYSFYRPLPEGVLRLRDIFIHALHGMGGDITRLLFTGFLMGLLGLLIPIVTGILLDQVVPNADLHMLGQFVIGLTVVAFASALFDFVQTFAGIRLQLKINASLQPAVIERLLRLPTRFFRQYTAGDLAMRAGGVDEIQETITSSVLSSLLSGAFSLLTLFLMFYYDVRLAMYALLLVIIATVVNLAATIVQLKYQRVLLRTQGELSGLMLQLLTNISKLRSTNSETRAFSVWASKFTETSKYYFRANKVVVNLSTFTEVFTVISTMILFALVILRGDNLTFGAFIAFNAAFGQFFAAFLGMTGVIATIVEVIPTYERVKPILQTVPEKESSGVDPGPLQGRVELTRVSFRYDVDMPFIFRDLNLYADAGEFIAIVGPSGAGKSTIFRLLLAFEQPEAGTILYDNRDLETLNLDSIRKQIGVVMQHSALMPGTISENVIGSSVEISEQTVWQALKAVALDEDIKAMPMQLHTVLTEGGTTLSVGQRQRLMIARAIIRKPKVLLFDEATSALDNRTQAIVHRNLEKMRITRIVAAHRLSTIERADRIYVLKDGQVIEEGTFEDLVTNKGIFAELAQRQQAQLANDDTNNPES